MHYSKKRIDRAGLTIARYLFAFEHGGAEALEGLSAKEWETEREIVEWWRRSHARPLSLVASNLAYYVEGLGPSPGQRLKKLPTIADKLVREPKMKLSRMGDIGGARAVLPDQTAAYAVANRLRKNWEITRFTDWVAAPKPDGYRALHLYVRRRERVIEVQLRTRNQHIWANIVERDARRFGLELKSGGGPAELSEYHWASAELIAQLDADAQPSSEFLAKFRRLHVRADTFRRRDQ